MCVCVCVCVCAVCVCVCMGVCMGVFAGGLTCLDMVFENFLPVNMDNEVIIGHRLRRGVLVVVHRLRRFR